MSADGVSTKPSCVGFSPSGTPTQSIVFEKSSPSHGTDEEDASVTIGKIAAYFAEMEERNTKRACEVTRLTQATTDLESKAHEAGHLQREIERERHGRQKAEERLRAQESLLKASVPKEEHDRLHCELNEALHNSLRLQREAAQLRTDILEQQSKEGREERSRLQEERWGMEQSHNEEVAVLRRRIDTLKEEQTVQLNKAADQHESDRKEFIRRLAGSVPSTEVDALREKISELKQSLSTTQTELASMVPSARMQAVEVEHAEQASQLSKLMAELRSERQGRRKEQEQVLGLGVSVQELQNALTKLQGLKQKAEGERNSLGQQLQVKENELCIATEKYDLLQGYYTENEKVLSKLQCDMEEATRSDRHTGALLEDARKSKTMLEEHLATATRAGQQYQAEVAEREAAINSLQQRVASLEGELDAQTSRATMAQREHARRVDEMSSERERDRRLVDDLRNEISTCSQEVLTNKHIVAEAAINNAELLAGIKKLTEQNERLKDEEEAGRVEHMRCQERHQETVAKLNGEMRTKEVAVRSLKEKVKGYERYFADHLKPALTAAKQSGLL